MDKDPFADRRIFVAWQDLGPFADDPRLSIERFAEGWDQRCISMLESTPSERSVITNYPLAFRIDPNGEERQESDPTPRRLQLAPDRRPGSLRKRSEYATPSDAPAAISCWPSATCSLAGDSSATFRTIQRSAPRGRRSPSQYGLTPTAMICTDPAGT